MGKRIVFIEEENVGVRDQLNREEGNEILVRHIPSVWTG